MYYDMNNGSYNLEKVLKVRHLKGVLRYGYKYYENGVPEKRWFFGLFCSRKALPSGYYYIDSWDNKLVPSTKEDAEYSANMVKVCFVGDKYDGREWTFNSEDEALEFIDMCKKSSSICKFASGA